MMERESEHEEKYERRDKPKDCPYGSNECPKVKTIKDDVASMKWKVDVIIIVIAAMYGTQILAILGMN